MRIVAKMMPDWIEPYVGQDIPVVTESDVPRFPVGKRFDWGLVMTALRDGVEVHIYPREEK